jgi:hypothetical protein
MKAGRVPHVAGGAGDFINPGFFIFTYMGVVVFSHQ